MYSIACVWPMAVQTLRLYECEVVEAMERILNGVAGELDI